MNNNIGINPIMETLFAILFFETNKLHKLNIVIIIKLINLIPLIINIDGNIRSSYINNINNKRITNGKYLIYL